MPDNMVYKNYVSAEPFIERNTTLFDILNKFFLKDFNTLHTELFNVASYANNVNDNFTKNILKTMNKT